MGSDGILGSLSGCVISAAPQSAQRPSTGRVHRSDGKDLGADGKDSPGEVLNSSLNPVYCGGEVGVLYGRWSGKGARLLFLRASDDQRVGVGALKHPRADYRNRVFANARATVSADDYPVELGWVVVTKSHRGRRLSTRIVGQLLPFAKNENIFATTRADERVLSFAFDYGFKINGKPFLSGRGYDLVLYLRNAHDYLR